MNRLILVIILVLLFSYDSYTQSDSSYKNRIDSILLARKFTKVKIVKASENGFNVRYFYPKSTGQMEMIEITEKIGEERWIFNYYFVNNEFVKLNKWNKRVPGDIKRAVANYYFSGNRLVFSEESNAKVSNINAHLQRIIYLKARSPR